MSTKVRETVLPLLAAFIWGTAFIFQSMAANIIPPLMFNALRSFIGAAAISVIIPIYRRFFPDEEKPVKTKKGRRDLIVAGLVCGAILTLASFLQQKGMEVVSAGKAGFITALYVVLVPLTELVFFRKKVPAALWISIGLAVTGLYFLCMFGEFSVEPYDILLVLCAVAFTVHIIFLNRFSDKVTGMRLSRAQFLTVAFISLFLSLITEKWVGWDAIFSCFWPILYTGALSSGVAYTLQILALKGTNTAVVSLLLGLESAFAVLAGAVFLGDRMAWFEYLGCGLMFCAVILSQLPTPKKKI